MATKPTLSMAAEERATAIVQKWMRKLPADVPVSHDQGVVLRDAIAAALSAESERELDYWLCEAGEWFLPEQPHFGSGCTCTLVPVYREPREARDILKDAEATLTAAQRQVAEARELRTKADEVAAKARALMNPEREKAVAALIRAVERAIARGMEPLPIKPGHPIFTDLDVALSRVREVTK